MSCSVGERHRWEVLPIVRYPVSCGLPVDDSRRPCVLPDWPTTVKDNEMGMPAWATDPSSMLITEAEYEALPSEVCKTIEVVDGSVIFCASPTPEHQQVSRNLTMALVSARPPSPCINVLQDTDMRFRNRNPYVARAGKRFTLRRPDVVVFRCLQPGELLWSDDV